MGGNKKKVDTELRTYFPKYFSDDYERLDNLREYYLWKVEAEIGEVDEAMRLFLKIQKHLVESIKPKVFNPYDERSILIENDKEFEEIISSMEENGMPNIRQSTVFEFYSKVAYLENKANKMKQYANK